MQKTGFNALRSALAVAAALAGTWLATVAVLSLERAS